MKSQGNSPALSRQREAPVISSWLDRWTTSSPIIWVDQYLVFIRWGSILAIGITSMFKGFQGETIISPLVALLLVTAYNLPISFYVWRAQPLARGSAGWLLLSDVLQSTVAVVLTGGYRSFFFILFLFTIAEIGLAFRGRMALALVISVDALQMGAAIFRQTRGWDPFAPYIIVSKFMISLIVGGLVVFLNELIYRENAAHKESMRTAARIAALNTIFMHLEESALDVERTLTVILDGTKALPDAACSLILIPNAGQWRVAASTTNRHPRGEVVSGIADIGNWNLLFTAGRTLPTPLPPFVVDRDIHRLTGVYLRSPDGETLGILVIGQRSDHPLSEDERAFLQSLALEAGLALRNARLYTQEREHVARLQRFEEIRSVFLSAVGHELKTPLAVLKMLAPSLRQLAELPQATQGEITETIERNIARLDVLITDLLESARLEAGAVALHPRAMDILSLARRVLDDMAPLLSLRRQRLALHTPDDLPQVWADSRRLEQILSNLLNNAAKFSPPGGVIDVYLSVTGDVVQVCVADVGPGVPPEEREHIFDKFYVGTGNEALAGVGLGLFICRELVRLHGGRIWVEDRSGGGSRFCFTIPIATREQEEST
ncbi:MAG: hypothetical protein J7M34_06815 [Anaerolineae bacterium]|nr:hypothetical protein [Anaerolineae bacterium]